MRVAIALGFFLIMAGCTGTPKDPLDEEREPFDIGFRNSSTAYTFHVECGNRAQGDTALLYHLDPSTSTGQKVRGGEVGTLRLPDEAFRGGNFWYGTCGITENAG